MIGFFNTSCITLVTYGHLLINNSKKGRVTCCIGLTLCALILTIDTNHTAGRTLTIVRVVLVSGFTGRLELIREHEGAWSIYACVWITRWLSLIDITLV